MRSAAVPEEQQAPLDIVPVGRIVDAYGVKGWVKVEAFSPDAAALLKAGRWWLQKADAVPLLILRQQIRWQGKSLVAYLEGLADRAQAESLKGSQILVSRQDFPDLAQDEYYWTDLIGCEAVNYDQSVLGQVVNVMDNGAHAILEIGNEHGARQWVPFVAAHVGRVDLQARRIEVNWLTPQ
jgi:16S rRNA processing protein RimM